MPRSRAAAVAALAVTCAAATVALAPPAGARPPASTLTVTSEAGDPVGGGGSYAHAQAAGDLFFVFTDNSGTGTPEPHNIGVATNHADGGDSWDITLSAPAGAFLVPGGYGDATRAGTDPTRPGIYVQRDGAGCRFPTGSFTVLDAVYGPYAYVQTFHATFEQRCEPGGPALRGELLIDNGPPPPPLEVGLTVDPRGTLRPGGQPVVSGTVTCNEETSVTLNGTVGRADVLDGLQADVVCLPGAPVPWRITGTPQSGYGKWKVGAATVQLTASGTDPLTHGSVGVDATATVRLARH